MAEIYRLEILHPLTYELREFLSIEEPDELFPKIASAVGSSLEECPRRRLGGSKMMRGVIRKQDTREINVR